MQVPLQLGWFTSGGGKAARDLLMAVQTAIRRRELAAEIAFVFCTRDPGEARESNLLVRLVNSFNIPFVSLSYQKFKTKADPGKIQPAATLPAWRLEYDRQVMAALEPFHLQLCVLAGYMLITGPEMCRKYDMINLHPAGPGGPTGTWQQVIWRLIESGARETGVMMHLVTPELDRGPLATYCTFSICGEPFDHLWKEVEGKPVAQIRREQGEDNPLFKAIRAHGLARELPLMVATIRAFSKGKVWITADKRVVDAGGRPISGYDLTEEIDGQVQRRR